MTEQVTADLDITGNTHPHKVNVSLSAEIDFGDLADEIKGSPQAEKVAELILEGNYSSIGTLAKDLSTTQRIDLIDELINTLSDSDAGHLCAGYCGVCEERDRLSYEVDTIEEERNE